MQGIEKNYHTKINNLHKQLVWVPTVGDLVRQKHGVPITGLITHVHKRQITVHWQRPNQNNVSGSDYEVLNVRYLELIESTKK